MNMKQDDAATDPKSGWTLPTGEVLPPAAIRWNSPSDPEPVEADHDQAVLLVGAGTLQDITSMEGGAGALKGDPASAAPGTMGFSHLYAKRVAEMAKVRSHTQPHRAVPSHATLH